MKKYSWKDIKKIVGKFKGETPTPSSSPKITPIFAHASVGDVRLNLSALHGFFDGVSDELDSYSYVVTLIEKEGKYKGIIRAFMKTLTGEAPILFEQESFSKNERDKDALTHFIRQPFTIFRKPKHILAMTFKNSDMSEEDFNNIIELWRLNKQTQN